MKTYQVSITRSEARQFYVVVTAEHHYDALEKAREALAEAGCEPNGDTVTGGEWYGGEDFIDDIKEVDA